MEENNKEYVKKYISAYESLSINNLDTLKNIFTNDIVFEDPFNKVNSFGIDYASTLSIWRNQFNKSWPRIKKLGFDERFYRMWNLYFSYCEGGFRSGCIDVKQVKLSSIN